MSQDLYCQVLYVEEEAAGLVIPSVIYPCDQTPEINDIRGTYFGLESQDSFLFHWI